MDIFKLVGSIFIDTDQANKSIQKTEANVENLGNRISGGIKTAAKWGTALAAGAMAGATGLAVAIGKASVKTGAEFDTAMAQVAATMGKTMDELKSDVASTTLTIGDRVEKFTGNLDEFAQKMGKETAFSAKEAAEALNYMALAGYDTQKSMDMLPSVLNLASAGAMDLASASDMVTDAQTALGLSQKQTTDMVDQMAKAASTSNTSVSQLGDAMLKIGATARNVKGGTVELSSVLGALADNGIKGAEAGTHMRNILLSLSGPKSNAAAIAMESIGLSFDDMYDKSGKLKDVRKIMLSLNGAMANLTDKERTRVLQKIFNKTDLASVNSLLGTSKKRWTELDSAIKDSQGAASDMANTQLDNLNGDITLFKSALSGTQILLSRKLTPTIRNFVKLGTAGFDKISEALETDGISGAIEAGGDVLGDLTAEIVKYTPQVISAGGQLLKGLGKGIKAAAPEVASGIQSLINSAIDLIGDISLDPSAGENIVNAVGAFLAGINWGGLVINLTGLAETIFDALLGAVTAFASDHPEIAFAIMNVITGFLVVGKNVSFASTFAPMASQIFSGFVAALVAAFAGFSFGKWLGDNYLTSKEMKQYQVDFKLSDFLKFDDSDWDDFWQAFADWWVDVEDWWSRKFSGMKKKVANWIGGIGDSVKNAINTYIIDKLNSGLRKINGVLGKVNKIPGVDVGQIGEIPHLAKGGEVTGSGLVQVGETGPELLNLPKGSSVTPVNSQNNAIGGVESLLRDGLKRLESLEAAMMNQKIVLDSGALVGGTVRKMDDALGLIAAQREGGFA